jgi:hypothetical protein
MLQQLARSAVHAARLNRRATLFRQGARTMASMLPQKEDELKNWTQHEVIEYARSIISAKQLDVDALKAATLDGASLLEMRQNQSFMDALIRDGLKPNVVHKLAGAVRKLVAPGVSPRYPLLPARLPVLPPCTWIAVCCPFSLCLASPTRASTMFFGVV